MPGHLKADEWEPSKAPQIGELPAAHQDDTSFREGSTYQ
jgi:hypothetical protein